MSEGTKQSHKLQIEFSQSVKNGLTQTLSLTSKLLTKTLLVKIERKIYCWKKKKLNDKIQVHSSSTNKTLSSHHIVMVKRSENSFLCVNFVLQKPHKILGSCNKQ